MRTIELRNGGTAEVSNEDFKHLSQWKWSRYLNHGHYYAIRDVGGQRILMHRIVADRMGLSGQITHKDGDRLNIQRSNLRSSSISQVGARHRRHKNNSSGYKGVSAFFGRFKATLTVNRRQFHLGYFGNKLEAAAAYDDAAIKHFGQHALLNLRREGYRTIDDEEARIFLNTRSC